MIWPAGVGTCHCTRRPPDLLGCDGYLSSGTAPGADIPVHVCMHASDVELMAVDWLGPLLYFVACCHLVVGYVSRFVIE